MFDYYDIPNGQVTGDIAYKYAHRNDCKVPLYTTKENYKKEVIKYINYLDEIGDYLDELDETAGVPIKVGDALTTMENYFLELLSLYK